MLVLPCRPQQYLTHAIRGRRCILDLAAHSAAVELRWQSCMYTHSCKGVWRDVRRSRENCTSLSRRQCAQLPSADPIKHVIAERQVGLFRQSRHLVCGPSHLDQRWNFLRLFYDVAYDAHAGSFCVCRIKQCSSTGLTPSPGGDPLASAVESFCFTSLC